jgi:hypothetical protein
LQPKTYDVKNALSHYGRTKAVCILFENRMLRKIFGPKEEVTGGWKKPA